MQSEQGNNLVKFVQNLPKRLSVCLFLHVEHKQTFPVNIMVKQFILVRRKNHGNAMEIYCM